MLKRFLVTVAAAVMAVGAAGGVASAADPTLHVVKSDEVAIPPASGGYAGQAAVSVSCPQGEVRTGGGALVTAGNSHADRYVLGATIPLDGEGWWAFASNSDPSAPGKVQAYVICAKVANVTTLTTP